MLAFGLMSAVGEMRRAVISKNESEKENKR